MPRPTRSAENDLLVLLHRGELAVDFEGRVWRFGARRGRGKGGPGSYLVPCEPRRAEHATPTGYLQVRAVVGAERVHSLAHRLVWRWFVGSIPDGLTINHKDGVKSNNRPANLELALSNGTSEAASSARRPQAGDGRTWDEMPLRTGDVSR